MTQEEVNAMSAEIRNQIEKMKTVLKNREKFIDWVINKHPEVVTEYLGFSGE